MNISSGRRFLDVAHFVLLFLFMAPRLGFAQASETESLRALVKDMQLQLEKALNRIDQLEKEKANDSAKIGQVEKSIQAVQSVPSILNPAIGLALDGTIEKLGTAGGNFNFRSAELGLTASVDPFARMYAFFTGSNEGVEVEEAAAITTSLPWNLTAKGGRFFADFGRFPKYHPHELPFVNQPLSIQRMVGGESQADGAEVNYLFPTPFFLRATVGGYNKIGADNEQVSNLKPRAASRFTYLGRIHNYFDVTDNHSIDFGTSLAYTPSVRLQGEPSGGDRILGGVDLTYRYQPLASAVYQGFTWGSEFYNNSQRFAIDDVSAKRQRSYGGYTYGELKLSRNWATGFLFDYAPIVDHPGRRTLSYSPYVTWNLSEFNRLRFQYSYLKDNFDADKAEKGNQFFVQWTTVIGSHTHGFLSR
jgi:hypothetical protein